MHHHFLTESETNITMSLHIAWSCLYWFSMRVFQINLCGLLLYDEMESLCSPLSLEHVAHTPRHLLFVQCGNVTSSPETHACWSSMKHTFAASDNISLFIHQESALFWKKIYGFQFMGYFFSTIMVFPTIQLLSACCTLFCSF